MKVIHTLMLCVAGLSACHLVLPFESPSPASSDSDQGVVDLQLDLFVGDVPVAPEDNGVQDDHPHLVDALPPLDAAPLPDSALVPDTTAPDMYSRAELPSYPCAASSIVQVYPTMTMAICQGGGPKPPCSAGAICGTNWHICTASEYLSRGGATVGSTTAAWLASCTRDGAAPTAPSDQPCTTCNDSGTGTLADVAWTCSGLLQNSVDYLYLAVKTSNACRRLGQPTAPSAMWSFDLATASSDAVVCCHDSP
jgi:hypothetical protein